MKDFKTINDRGQPGMLVFVRLVRHVLWDENLETETFVYEEKMKAGFILEKHSYFEGYYNVKFFTGEKELHWGIDLFELIEEPGLTYLQK